ncbi:threonine/serine exporter family protein [Angustibacter luteus]|uniref:Threonine/serine exporter ThrE family protein n=1 Tax=Angustibacter luteus TaxID=658456 RepID=A0ABW1JBK4_9ACTN
MTEPTGRGSGQPHQPGLAWQRWLRSEEPTGPVPLVDRLRGTPFRDPSRMGAPQEEQAREVIEFGLRLGDLLLRSGSGTRDVEAALIAVTAAMGLTDVEVDITAQSILLQHAPAGGRPVNLLRVARTQSRDHARLADAYRLVSDLVAGRCSREEADRRLTEIETRPKPWPRWVVSVAYGLLAAAVCALVGGGARATALAFVASVAVDRLGRYLGRRRLVPFFITFVGAAIAAVVTVLAAELELIGPRDAGAVIAGGIVVLLPGRLLVAAVEDAIFGFSVTASGRVLQVLLTGAAIISGTAIGLGLAQRLDLDLVVDLTGTTAVDVVRGLVCAAVASLATAVAYRSPRRLVLPPVLIGVIGYAIYGLLRVSDLAGPTAATAAAAVVVGLLARLLAARMTAPALVLSVPALSTLLPGLAIFRAMSLLSSDPQAGIGQLFLAMATALAIGAGVALGDVLAAPADRWWLRRAAARPSP